MERLTLCSKVLYDRDILQKQKKIIELKEIVDGPKILFDNIDDYQNQKNKIFLDLEKEIKNYFNDFNDIYGMDFWALSFDQQTGIAKAIIFSLLKLTKNKNLKWAEYVAWNIVTGVEGFINGILKVKSIETIIRCFTPQDFGVIIFESIQYQLDQSYLDNITIFKCKICEKINDLDECSDCESN